VGYKQLNLGQLAMAYMVAHPLELKAVVRGSTGNCLSVLDQVFSPWPKCDEPTARIDHGDLMLERSESRRQAAFANLRTLMSPSCSRACASS
jgi:hypothetical protein